MHAWLTISLDLSTTSSQLESFAMQVAKFSSTALAARSLSMGRESSEGGGTSKIDCGVSKSLTTAGSLT
jgi:hypothetical protein